MKSISIVIPNYNGAGLLRKNLPQVIEAVMWYQAKTDITSEIIVTDDHSVDESQEVVASFGEKIRYLPHERNTGFSGNVNRGVKQAQGDIIVLLNTDVTPEKQFLFPLLSHFENDETLFAVGCLDVSSEKGKEVKRGNGKGSWSRGFLLHRAGDVTSQKTLWASGGSSAFSKAIWQKLHGLCELYNPFYWEDIDLSYRAQKAGYRVRFEPLSIVKHSHDEGSIKSQFTSERITAVAYRNQILFVWLTITDTTYLLSHVIWLPIHCLQAVISGNKQFLSGFMHALSMLPRVLSKRKSNKRIFTRRDAAIIHS